MTLLLNLDQNGIDLNERKSGVCFIPQITEYDGTKTI